MSLLLYRTYQQAPYVLILNRIECSLLNRYAHNGHMIDSVVIHTDPASAPFLDMKEEDRPEGFRDWRKFGSPPGAPGQALHHPAIKEHEFIAWILAMHFLSALEMVAADQSSSILTCSHSARTTSLPPPVLQTQTNRTMNWQSLMLGVPVDTDKWSLNPTKCRTTFEPIVQGSLDSLVVVGTYGDGTDIMLPKGAMYYSKGWVMDLSDEEKLAKRKLDRFNGLGYMDSKKAYYGIFASGPLRLFLPYEGARQPQVTDRASDWFRSIVTCQVNEKREAGSCSPEAHMSFTIGGINATNVEMIDSAGTLYYGKKLCIYVPVPKGAKLTRRHAMYQDLKMGINNVTDAVGLSVELAVKDVHIWKKSSACSVSHLVWEQL